MEIANLEFEGFVWKVEPAWAERLRRHILPSIARLDEDPRARLLKKSMVRTVYRLTLPDDRQAIFKVYHLRRWRQRLKAMLLGPTPLREWRVSQRLLGAGLPVSHAVAVGLPAGKTRGLEGYLVLEAAPRAVPLNEALAQRGLGHDWGSESLALVHKLAGLVRTLHDRGVWHRDLHCGNVLVRTDVWETDCPFVVVDLHRMRLSRLPHLRHKKQSIALLLRTCVFWQRWRDDLVAAFLDAYLREASPGERSALQPSAIIREADRQRRRRLRSRAKRCLRNSSRFVVEEIEGWRVYRSRDYPLAELLRVVRSCPAKVADAGRLKVSVTRVRRREGGSLLEVRQYRDGLVSRVLPVGPWRPRGLTAYAAAHAETVRSGKGPRAVAAMVGRGGENRGRSIAIVALEEPP